MKTSYIFEVFFSHKLSLAKLALTLLLILFALFSSAQNNLLIFGESKVEGNDHKDKKITLKKDTTTIKILEGKRKFDFNLELDSEYTITFSKPNYITKTVLINTKFISSERRKHQFKPFGIAITIFPQPEDSISTYIQPIGVIGFSETLDGFHYRTFYNKKTEKRN